MHKRGTLSIIQIFVLVFGVIAISYSISKEFELVGANEDWTSVQKEKLEKIKTDLQDSAPEPVHGYAGKAYEFFFKRGSTTHTTEGFTVSGIAQAAGWAIIVFGAVKMVGGFLGIDGQKVNAAATAASAGVFVGQSLNTLFTASTPTTAGGALSGTWAQGAYTLGGKLPLTAAPFFWGAVIAVAIFVMTYKKVSQRVIEVSCTPWSPKTGGSNCERCNQQGGLPCSEYQCRSLGHACQLLNQGTKDVKCTWVNKNDVNPPVIQTNKNALLDGYSYKPDNTISPPDRGVIIFNGKTKEGCAKAFTPLIFGISLDEPAQCKLDYLRKNSFDEMDFFFGGTLFNYNHTQVMSLPGPDNIASENLTIQNDGNFELYTRCRDANGNANTATFVFKFCVEKGPDTTPPLIVTTNLLNNMPIAYNQNSVDLEVYVNEPSECKWSPLDKVYDEMEETMVCSLEIAEMNAQMLYTCKTTLTGLKNSQKNKFYFRCRDKPLATTDRNTNAESYQFTLIGTQPLVLDSVGPNGTIKDSTDIIKVELNAKTSAGYKEGESTCYYSSTGNENDYVMFFSTLSHKHSQELYLPQGNYNYFIKCIDLGGNSDIKETKFSVESDSVSPLVVRAYHDQPYLKLITNEDAECVYDTKDCSYLFEDGTNMGSTGEKEHFTNWNTKTTFYIKCKDKYGNQPMPNECSITVKAFDYK